MRGVPYQGHRGSVALRRGAVRGVARDRRRTRSRCRCAPRACRSFGVRRTGLPAKAGARPRWTLGSGRPRRRTRRTGSPCGVCARPGHPHLRPEGAPAHDDLVAVHGHAQPQGAGGAQLSAGATLDLALQRDLAAVRRVLARVREVSRDDASARDGRRPGVPTRGFCAPGRPRPANVRTRPSFARNPGGRRCGPRSRWPTSATVGPRAAMRDRTATGATQRERALGWRPGPEGRLVAAEPIRRRPGNQPPERESEPEPAAEPEPIRTRAPRRRRCRTRLLWRARQDSNLRPSAPEADALSTELQARDVRDRRSSFEQDADTQSPPP